MRLFIGIEVPDEIKKAIEKNLHPLKLSNKGWENPVDYHLTLLFLGETPEEKITDIKKRLNDIKFESFELTLINLVFFPRRILYVAMEDSLKLVELQKLVEATYPEWVRPESKPFIPHITVKRWQRYEHDQLESLVNASEFVPLKIQVKELHLFKSEMDAQFKKYHII